MTKRNLKLTSIIGIMSALLFWSSAAFAQDGWEKQGNSPDKYETRFDKKNQHDGKKALTIKSVAPILEDYGTLVKTIVPGEYAGKRIRMTGYIKTSEVIGWAGLSIRTEKDGGDQALTFDNMQKRPVKGTTDWTKYELVLDVPANATAITFGAMLNGPGQIWFDILDFEVVDKSTPTTGN